MSLLEELNTVAADCGIPVETGKFSGVPSDKYLVITPLTDSFDLHSDNMPQYEIQEARLSLFVKNNYSKQKKKLIKKLLLSEISITDRRYVGYEVDTGYHHYAFDVAKIYEYQLEMEEC